MNYKPVKLDYSNQEIELLADVLVVGLGAAGGCAAIEAFDTGAEVIIIEKQSEKNIILIPECQVVDFTALILVAVLKL